MPEFGIINLDSVSLAFDVCETEVRTRQSGRTKANFCCQRGKRLSFRKKKTCQLMFQPHFACLEA